MVVSRQSVANNNLKYMLYANTYLIPPHEFMIKSIKDEIFHEFATITAAKKNNEENARITTPSFFVLFSDHWVDIKFLAISTPVLPNLISLEKQCVI